MWRIPEGEELQRISTNSAYISDLLLNDLCAEQLRFKENNWNETEIVSETMLEFQVQLKQVLLKQQKPHSLETNKQQQQQLKKKTALEFSTD